MNKKVEKILDKLLAAFESGDVPQAIAVAVLPRLAVPCSMWSLCNRIMLYFADTSDARGFRQWQQVGRYPKKGSKAVYIMSPKNRKVTNEAEEDKMVVTGFVPVPVFRFEDTDGEPLDTSALMPIQLPPLYEVAECWGIQVSWQSYQGDGLGYYQPGKEKIVLATHDSKVFFHELAHAAHGKIRGGLALKQDWKQEIVAELSAAVLTHLFGQQPNDGEAYRYIRRYAQEANKDTHQACLSVIADVGKCVELIMQTKQKESALLA